MVSDRITLSVVSHGQAVLVHALLQDCARYCGDAIEVEIAGLARRIETRAAEMGFQVARQTVEANGLCRRCRPDSPTHAR